jgi:hypothetical protein
MLHVLTGLNGTALLPVALAFVLVTVRAIVASPTYDEIEADR